jgi:hypothetical protein
MKPLGKLMRHVGLVRGMARATDLDLAQVYENGVLSQQDWSDMVQTCRGCSWAPRCDDWLSHKDGAQCAPATCLNRARFEELRRRARAS